MNHKERIGSFDANKAFAMFLVIWGHCIMHLTSVSRVDDTTFVFINSFHMPLFMIMAGYFSTSSLRMDFKTLSLKKFKELFIPCMCWGIILFITMIFIEGDWSIGKFFDYLLMKYWFLRSLFCCYLLAFIVTRTTRRLAVVVVCCSLFITLYKLNLMFPAFMCGFLMKKTGFLDNKKHTGWISILLLTLVFSILIWFYDAHILNTPNRMLSIIQSNSINVWMDYFYKILYRVFVGISGALIVIILFYKYLRNVNGVICQIGQKTLGIYLIQGLFLERLLPHIYRYEGGAFLFDVVIAPLLSIIILVGCYYLVLLIEKNKSLSVVLLGK